MDVLHDRAAGGFGQLHIGKVPDGVYAAAGQRSGDSDGRRLGDREHRDINMVTPEIALQLVHAVNVDAAVLRTDERGLDVKGGDQLYAPVGEAEVLHQRAADVADADQDRGKAPVRAENTGDLGAESGYIVAVALLSEFAEAVEIMPDLGGREAQLLPQLSGLYFVDAVLAELIQLSQIARKAADHIVGYLDSLHGFSTPYCTSERYSKNIPYGD